MSETAVLIKNLSFKYAGSNKFILKNINLTIKEGEFIVIAGPSGSGKTTLARCIVGLIPHFYAGEYFGQVVVYGREVAHTTINEITKFVGYVFQNPENQLFMTTVIKDVAFRLEYLGMSREEIVNRVNRVLSDLRISHLSNKRIDDLSGGEKQKVAIAGILVSEPKVIILDEPTAYLSPRSVLDLLNLLIQLNRKNNITIILIEHRLDLVIKPATRLIVIYDGEVTVDGSPDKVLAKPLDRLYGLNIPVVSKLCYVLRDRWGLSIDNFVPTPEDLAEKLAEVLSK